MITLYEKYAWIATNFISGNLAFFFFVWVAFDMHPPFYPPGYDLGLTNEVHIQQERLPNSSDLRKMVLNMILFLAWGFVHSFTAQTAFRMFLTETVKIPKEAVRTVFAIVCSVANFFLFHSWNHIDISYRLIPFVSHEALRTLSVVLFVAIECIVLYIIAQYGMLEFTGLGPLLNSSSDSKSEKKVEYPQPQLITNGWWGLVRHPIYFFTAMALIFTPYLSLDRLTITIGALAYLSVGVPVEERKLKELFGKEAYETYSKKVPAYVPSFASLQKFLNEKLGRKVK